MPWCPKCSTEYVETIKECPECRVPLRAAPGLDEFMFEDRTWAVIRETENSVEASIIKDILEERGFEVKILDKHSYQIPVGGPGWTSRVLVPTEASYGALMALRARREWSEQELTEYMEAHGGLKDGDISDYLDSENEEDDHKGDSDPNP